MRWMTFCLVLLAATAAMAKDFTVGTVDFQRIFNTYPGTVKAQKKLDDLIKVKQDDLTDSQKIVVSLQRELKNSMTLSPGEKKKKEKEIKAREQSLMDEKNQVEKELAGRKREMMRELVTEVNDVISNAAIKAGVDMVVDGTSVHYLKSGTDLTADILKSFSKTDSSN
jgi:Skp family chaperone for outer membrane proteins